MKGLPHSSLQKMPRSHELSKIQVIRMRQYRFAYSTSGCASKWKSCHQQIQYFLAGQLKQMSMDLDVYLNQQLSFLRPSADTYLNEIQILMDKQLIGTEVSFQKSIIEMEELLDQFTYDSPVDAGNLSYCESSAKGLLNDGKQVKQGKEKGVRKQKKIKKVENSPFHNYQKHLNNALKKLIIVPSAKEDDNINKKVAVEIWKAYEKSEIRTKRILHFVFNERNEHTVNEPELKTYGMWHILRVYGEEALCNAKNYLAKLAIDQLDHHSIDNYLSTRKLKSKDEFKSYILAFKSQLEQGFLKRRINVDKLSI